MNAEKHFENWYNSSLIAEWINNKDLVRDVYLLAFRAGVEAKYKEIASDREMLELLLEELDQQDVLDEQEELIRG